MGNLKESELVLAPDGSLYHIHLTGESLADDVVLVGDPGRVEMFKQMFESVEYESVNREMHALTGRYRGHRFTVLSTGMGCDNIDIVMTELDAAANIDLSTRREKPEHRTLNIIRIGTSGSLHADIPCGSLLASAYAVGLDGLMNYYRHDPALFETELNSRIVAALDLPQGMAAPYSVAASGMLLQKVASGMAQGITATAPGFYAPQGRNIRIAPAMADLNERLAAFSWNGLRATNLEMETSAIYGFARIMGHNALTVCLVIANRADGTFLNDYHGLMKDSIAKILDHAL